MARVEVARKISPARAVGCVLLPFAAGYYLSYLFRTINAVIATRLVDDLGLDAAQLGLLSGAYFFAFALSQLPLGIALDRYGPRRVQLALLPIAACGAAIFATSHDLRWLIAGRAMIGLGVAGALMAGLKALVIWLPKERLPLANGCLIMLGALGAASATLPAEAVLGAIGWRALFMVLAVATAAAAMLLLLSPPWQRDKDAPAAGLGGLLDVYRNGAFWRLAPMSTACIGTSFALQGLWAGPWLTDVARLPRGTVVGDLFAMSLALCGGALLLGTLADRLRRFGVQPSTMLAAAAAISLVAQASLAARLAVPAWLPWMIVAAAGSATVLSYASIAEVFPSGMAGRANSALNVLHIGGAFVIQSGIGMLIAHWRADVAGHAPASAYTAALTMNLIPQIIGLIWFLLPRRAAGNRGWPVLAAGVD